MQSAQLRIAIYIKPRTHRLNGKAERSHLTDKLEFYQLLEYKNDVDLPANPKEWEKIYDFEHPHTSLKDKIPYKVLRQELAC